MSALAPRRPARLLPLDGLYLRRIAELEQLVGEGAYHGWGRDGRAGGLFFVDVGDAQDPDRFHGETLHLALGAAIRANARTEAAASEEIAGE